MEKDIIEEICRLIKENKIAVSSFGYGGDKNPQMLKDMDGLYYTTWGQEELTLDVSFTGPAKTIKELISV